MLLLILNYMRIDRYDLILLRPLNQTSIWIAAHQWHHIVRIGTVIVVEAVNIYESVRLLLVYVALILTFTLEFTLWSQEGISNFITCSPFILKIRRVTWICTT